MIKGFESRNKKIKIIISNPSIYAGGAESEFRTLTNYLSIKGYDVTAAVIYYSDYKELKTSFSRGVKIIRSRLPQKTANNQIINLFYRTLRGIYRLFAITYMNLQHYDVSIAFKEGLSTIDTLHIRSARKFAWIHSDFRIYNEMASSYTIAEEHDLYKKYNNVICVSETAKAGFIDTLGDTSNLLVRYNPMNWIDIRQKAEEKCPILRDTKKPLIITIGTFEKGKNFGVLLEAVKLLKGVVSFELWMLGKDGPDTENLKLYANANSLNNVNFLGFKKNPYCYLKQADLFISTSLNETYGLAVQEAFILGKPVIAVKNDGIVEAFDERFGRIIDNSAQELADTIRSVLESPFQLETYGNNIKNHYLVKDLYEERMEEICQLFV